MLGSNTTGVTKNAPAATTSASPVAADRTDPPKRSGGVFARLSGAPEPYTSPEAVVEEAVEVTDDEETNGEASDVTDGETGGENAVPLFAAPSSVFANVGEKKSEEDATPTTFSTAARSTNPDPSAATTGTGTRTPLAVELDL